MNPQIADTSRRSLGAVGLRGRKTLADKIHGVVQAAQRNGARDMSMREIQRTLAEREVDANGRPLWVDVSSISGRVNELVAAQRLLRDRAHPRPCLVSGRMIEPLSVPVRQERLCY